MEHHKPTLFEVLKEASIFLGKSEDAERLARYYWMELFDLSLTDVVLNMHQPVNLDDLSSYQKALHRIVQDEPIQYIKGYTYFNDKRFKVTPAVLIPRPETQGLLDLIKQKRPEDNHYRMLDIGTGSGILGINLALMYPKSQVSATDISPQAMAIAKENQQIHQVDVINYVTDLVEGIPLEPPFDIIVSNPPYISEKEIPLMTENVLKYEPFLALFAANDGLAIYENLAKELPRRMKEDGLIALEIGFNQGQLVQALFKQAFPEAEVTCHQDFNDLDRYILIDLNRKDSQ